MNPVWVIGNGGHAKVVIDAIACQGLYQIAGVLSDSPDEPAVLADVSHHGPVTRDLVQRLGVRQAVIAVGDNLVRARIANMLDGCVRFVPVIHPSATVALAASIGAGAVISAGSVVQAGAVIDDHAIINTAATVDHDCYIGEFAHIAPGCHLAGNVSIGRGTLMGIGSVAIPGVVIGPDAIVGAGSVVIRDVDPADRVAGVPARPLSR